MTNLYEKLATYYQVINAHVTDDISFFVELAKKSNGSILELGCGNGRILIPTVKAGCTIVGLDNSPEMLALARTEVAARKLPNEPELLLGDMTDFNLDKMFSMITVPFNTWLHLPNENAQLNALCCIKQHLLPEGRLVIDVPAPATIVDAEHNQALTLEGTFVLAENGDTLLQFASTRLDEENHCLHVTWIYDRVTKEQTIKRIVVPMALRYIFPQEMDSLLRRSGLQLDTMWGDYDRSTYDSDSERLLIVAKPGTA